MQSGTRGIGSIAAVGRFGLADIGAKGFVKLCGGRQRWTDVAPAERNQLVRGEQSFSSEFFAWDFFGQNTFHW